ncbi:MAG: hypothetical protein IIC52_11280 [Proteobacteria bacterium]|nr:hypothetical protein [Pseudomonadota bacterium]
MTHFKVKLFGQEEQDLERLGQIAAIIKKHCSRYAFTLDGNEQYKEIGAFQSLWERVQENEPLREFFKYLLFVEQPFHRDVALSDATDEALRGWRGRPAMIIDESDATLDSVVEALAKGYAGTSHKNCKGVMKGIANACLIEHRRRKDPSRKYVNSVEDLCNIGPIALLQDFAVAATLGIDHVERNGHQYFRGLSMFGPKVQEAMLKSHGDLYRWWAVEGLESPIATVAIKEGRVNLGSVVDAPFGVGIDLDCDPYTPLEEWTYESLVG